MKRDNCFSATFPNQMTLVKKWFQNQQKPEKPGQVA